MVTLAEILALPMLAPCGDLKVAGRSWPKGTDRTPAALEALAAGDLDAFLRAVGPASVVVLSDDGSPVDTTGWCECPARLSGLDGDVRYERWVAGGRVAHGFACRRRVCRRLTQTG